jgi:hypothetical protein
MTCLLFVWWCTNVYATFNNISVGGQFYWKGKPKDPEKTQNMLQVTDKLYQIMLNTSPWSRIELTTSVVIDTHYIGSWKSIYYIIMAMTPPGYDIPNVVLIYMSIIANACSLRVICLHLISVNINWFRIACIHILCIRSRSREYITEIKKSKTQYCRTKRWQIYTPKRSFPLSWFGTGTSMTSGGFHNPNLRSLWNEAVMQVFSSCDWKFNPHI